MAIIPPDRDPLQTYFEEASKKIDTLLEQLWAEGIPQTAVERAALKWNVCYYFERGELVRSHACTPRV